jgi:hypothetical protein
MAELLNKTITIKTITKDETYGKYKIEAEQGGSYTFFEKIKAGGESVAYKNFKELNPTKGSQLEIAYSEKENPNGKFPYKNIMAMKLPEGVAFNNSQASPKVIKDIPQEKDDVEGRVRHGVAIAFIQKGEVLDYLTARRIKDWVDFIMTGENKGKSTDEITIDLNEEFNQ